MSDRRHRWRRAALGIPLLLVMIATAAREVEHAHLGFLIFAAATIVLGGLSVAEMLRGDRRLRAAHGALAADNVQLEHMFSDASIGMALADEQRRWVRVNPALSRMLGYRDGELDGCDPVELTPREDRELTSSELLRLETDALSSVTFEKRYLHRSGREIWTAVTISPSHDPGTGQRFNIVQIQDIDLRRRAELAYVRERNLFDAFLAGVPEQVYFKDRDSRFIRVSDLQAQRAGLGSARELIGLTDADVFDAEHAAKARADELQIMATGQPLVDVEERELLRSTDDRDSVRWVLTTKLPLRDIDANVIGTFGISRDITARKRAELALGESEERWRMLLEELQEIVLLVDPGGQLTFATPSFKRWLGYDPEALLGTPIVAISHPDDRQALVSAFADTVPQRPATLTHRVRHADGSWHILESRLVCLRENPTVGAVVVAATDVTDRERLEEERERLESERRVAHRLEAVGQLAAGIAHEINTPLQFVGDSVSFLKEAVDELLILTGLYREMLWHEESIPLEARRASMTQAEDDADMDYLLERIPAAFARTADGVARVRSIVQAMKRFSHPNAGEVAPADLNEALETTLEVCRNEYKYCARVVLDLQPLPAVMCNVGEINQVFLNLIVNAAQAIQEQRDENTTELGEIRVATAAGAEHVSVTIADDGPGIPAELLERIYEPFFTTKEVGKGTGQGLALARTTIEHHGGSLRCESSAGVGTTFTIRLPLTPPPTNRDGRAAADGAGAVSAAPAVA